MWWAGAKPIDVYVGTRRVAVLAQQRPDFVQPVVGCEQALSVLAEQLQQMGGRRRVRVWLSGGLCRPFIQELPVGSVTSAEVEKIALATASQRTGLEAPCSVWIEHCSSAEPRIAVAASESLLRNVQNSIVAVGLCVASIGPWWAEALRHVLTSKGQNVAGLGAQDCDSVTVLTGAGREFANASTFSPVVDIASAKAIVARLALSSSTEQARLPLIRLNDSALEPSRSLESSLAFGRFVEVTT